jgi:dual specificity MAP kinase phosphatase
VQGVSRSTTLIIGYLMWKLGKPYDDVYQIVRALRGVASPNIGFTCQLLQWQVCAATAQRSTAPRGAAAPTHGLHALHCPRHTTIVLPAWS